ncbi:hypothetical protein [Amycolatopsis sp. CA-230715]|uniref:hypothetical protein n=1 Tax=Amycolatopsis sp. CA-230715 TaxID=2745196 RepID=UPI001C02E7ED|nr:hypothetical protein [Amycolatopsis sp. CA-230715]QWF85492.1 hypothetical protein HUW46_08946 [Amycolatopsis sp. CA-230715]
MPTTNVLNNRKTAVARIVGATACAIAAAGIIATTAGAASAAPAQVSTGVQAHAVDGREDAEPGTGKDQSITSGRGQFVPLSRDF